MTRTAARLAGAAALVVLLAGCGQTVDEDQLVDQVSDAVEQASGEAPDTVECPESLDAEEGATTTCEATVADDTYDVGVEVTGVDDDTAQFDIDVPDELLVPRVATDALEEQVTSQLTEQVGVAPDEVDCPDELQGEVGATTTCTLESEGEEYDVALEVTSVDGTDVGFSIQVASEPNA